MSPSEPHGHNLSRIVGGRGQVTVVKKKTQNKLLQRQSHIFER